MRDLKIGVKFLLGAIIGLLTGIGLFFNLPSFSSFIGFTVGITIISGLIGFGMENFSNKAVGTVFLGLMLFLSFQAYNTTCFNEFVERVHTPSKNPLTGDIVTDEFEGFRFKICEYGSHPWYFDDLSQEEINKFCENNSDLRYCEIKMKDRQISG